MQDFAERVEGISFEGIFSHEWHDQKKKYGGE